MNIESYAIRTVVMGGEKSRHPKQSPKLLYPTGGQAES